jgi:5-enolpyruvylshikimate-3-phosphate synthase
MSKGGTKLQTCESAFDVGNAGKNLRNTTFIISGNEYEQRGFVQSEYELIRK